MISAYMEIGPTPCEESCAQVGIENYRIIASKEMDVYINQLNRKFEDIADENHIVFGKKWFNHDFGSYGEVVVYYDESDENSVQAAFHIESNLPYNWDEEALIELEKAFEALLEIEKINDKV